MATELPALTVADAAAWRAWLGEHHHESGGVWLVLAKKGTAEPTSLAHDEALEEALAHGWIDGQVRRGDQHTYRQRFTPRRARSRRPAGAARSVRGPADGPGGDAAPTGAPAAGEPVRIPTPDPEERHG